VHVQSEWRPVATLSRSLAAYDPYAVFESLAETDAVLTSIMNA
jgi:hypothetical protein